jgi:hypothetical protein
MEGSYQRPKEKRILSKEKRILFVPMKKPAIPLAIPS